jgi:histidinol-phosphate aminotransferase
VIIRTLSKAFGAAGLRLGACIANSKLTEIFRAIIPPYPISHPSIKLAEKILDIEHEQHFFEKTRTKILQDRDYLISELKKFTFITKVFDTATNYIFVQLETNEKARELYSYLLKNGFVVRLQTSQMTGGIRLSVGNKQQNLAFIDVLSNFCLHK